MQTKLVSYKTYLNPEFEKAYQKLEIEQLPFANLMGKQDGSFNKPISKQYYRIQNIQVFKTAVQKIIDFNYMLHKPYANFSVANELRNTATEEVQMLNKGKNSNEKKVLHIKNEIRELSNSINYISPILTYFVPILFGLIEGVLIFSVLQNASFPSVAKYLLSFVLAISAAFGLNTASNFICNTPKGEKTVKKYTIVFGLALLAATALGMFRASLSNESAALDAKIEGATSLGIIQNYSVVPFILITFICFVTALGIKIKFWQSKEHKSKSVLIDEKKKELNKINEQQKYLDTKISELKTKTTNESGAFITIQEYAFSNERRLLTLADQIVSAYESSNLEFRPKNDCPEFFGESIASEFQLYFKNIFNNIKE